VQGGEELLPGCGLRESLTAPRQGEAALRGELGQAREKEASEAAGEDPDGQKEVGPTGHPSAPIQRRPSGREDTMQMRVRVELLPPGMQHGEAADLGPEVLRIAGNVLERLGDRAKEQPIELTGVLEGERSELMREGKDDMGVGCLEYLTLPGREPSGLGRPMAFRAAPMAARVIGLHFVPAGVTLGDMAPKGRCPT
jgi:hypothetical protein